MANGQTGVMNAYNKLTQIHSNQRTRVQLLRQLPVLFLDVAEGRALLEAKRLHSNALGVDNCEG